MKPTSKEDARPDDRIRQALEILDTFKESDPSSRFCKEITLGRIRKIKKLLEGNHERTF